MQCLHDTSVRYACNDWWRPEHGLFYFSSDRIARYIRASGSYCTIALLRDVSGALSVTHTARCIQPALPALIVLCILDCQISIGGQKITIGVGVGDGHR